MRRSLWAFALISIAAALSQPPNILFLMCDSMDGRVLDPTSDVSQRLEMPNLRKLAGQGVNFVRTYAASPQCVPSRTTMFTGRRIDQTETFSNEQGVAAIPSTGGLDSTCVQLFDEQTCSGWKKTQNVHATLLDSLRSLNYEPHLYGKDHDEANATKNGFHSGPSLSILTRTADIRRPTKPDPIKITSDDNDHVHPEDWKMISKCIDFLNNLNTEHATAPQNWMLYCSINIPHPAFQTNATWLKYVHEDKVNVPQWIDEKDFHPADSYMSISKNVWRNFTDDEITRVRKTYYAMCAETDFMLGLVIDALDRSGQRSNTYVMFLSDHGEMNMEHRQASSRVPMMVAGPGIPQGVVVQNLTSLLDVYPTLVEMAGGTPGGFLSGHSLMPFLAPHKAPRDGGTPYPDDRAVVSQYHSNMGNTGSYMLRHGKWKYIAFGTAFTTFAKYRPQLFDVDSDPEELHDVSADNADVVRALDAKLRAVVDYEAVDKKAKANDQALYAKFFANKMPEKKLRKKFASAYKGFDDDDWKKIQAWAKQTPDAAVSDSSVRMVLGK